MQCQEFGANTQYEAPEKVIIVNPHMTAERHAEVPRDGHACIRDPMSPWKKPLGRIKSKPAQMTICVRPASSRLGIACQSTHSLLV